MTFTFDKLFQGTVKPESQESFLCLVQGIAQCCLEIKMLY